MIKQCTRLSLVIVITLVVGVASHRPAVTTAQAPESPVVATFRGSYNGYSTQLALGPFPLHAGLVIVRARHNGTGNLVVTLRLPEPGVPPAEYSPDSYLVADGIGRYNGAGATMVRTDGDYYIVLAASGAYELTVEQPSPTNVTPTDERTFTGLGQQVTAPMFLRAGTVTLAAQTDQQFLTVWVYAIDDLGGAAVGPGYDGRIIDTTRETGLVVSMEIPADGLYMLAVATGVTSERWRIEVQ